LAHTYSIPWSVHKKKGYAGGSIWSTASVDPQTGYAYAGTGNPFNAGREYETTNSIIKMDLDPRRKTFGQIVGSNKGNVDQYFGELEQLYKLNPLCGLGLPATIEHPECLQVDADFGAQPNISEDAHGRTMVGDG